MTDIYDAIARGFRYPPRPEDFFDEEWSDDDEVPPAPIDLPPAQFTSLTRAIDRSLQERGCDNTLRAAHAWAQREKVAWARLRTALEDHGGYCDCEVLLNVVDPPG